MNRRGFALLAVLWVLALLSAALAVTSAELRTEFRASRNRVLLARGRWAAEACVAIATDRMLADSNAVPDTVALGRDLRCTWALEDPARKLDVNRADRAALARFLTAHGLPDSQATVVVERLARRRSQRPFVSAAQLVAIGVPAAAAAQATPDHIEGVSADAPAEVLAAAGLSASAVALLEARRSEGRRLTSLAQLQDLVAPASLGLDYQTLAGVLRFAPSQLLLRSTGWAAQGTAPRTEIELLVRNTGDRFAVLRRRQS